MNRSKTWLIVILLILGVPLLGGGIYWFLVKGPAREFKLIDAVPQNTSLIFITQDASQIWQKMKDKNEVWDALRMTETFSRLQDGIFAIDSLLKSQTNVNDFLNDREVIISLHSVSRGKTEVLLLLPLSSNIEEAMLSDLLGNNAMDKVLNESMLHRYKRIKATRLDKDGQVIYYTYRHRVLLASFSPEILAMSLQQLNKPHWISNNPQIENLLKTAGNHVDGTLIFNFDYLPEIFKKWPASDFIPGFGKLKKFAHYASLDLYFQKKKIILNGYSLTRPGDFLRLFRNQAPQEPTALNLLPEHTASYIYLCFDNFDNFIDSYNDYFASFSSPQQPSQQLSFSAIQNLKESQIAEIASGLINTGSETALDNSLVILHSLNPQHFERMIKETLPSTETGLSFTINQREFRKIDFNRFFGNFLSSILPDFQKAFFFRIGDYFLFSSKPQILHDYIVQYLCGKTLVNTQGFKALSEISEERTNLWFYYNPTEAVAFHHFLFAAEAADNFDANLPVLTLFDAVSVQVSGEGQFPYISTIIKHRIANEEILALYSSTILSSDTLADSHSRDIRADERLLWKNQLDHPAAQPVVIVNDLVKGKSFLLAFDQRQNTYLFDAAGSLKWKKQIEGSGEAFCRVECIKINNQPVLFFITRSRLYAIDASGRMLAGYPIKLNIPLAGPASIFPQKNSSELRIYYPGTDSLLYCINIKGKPINGWNPPKLTGQVVQAVKRFEFEGKTYFAVPYSSGQVTMIQGNGKKAELFEQAFTNSSNSEFYLHETNRKGALLTTDQSGNLVYLSPKGPIEKTVFDNFSKNHFFIYEDFDNNGSRDFIYLDGKQLVIYDRFKNILLQHQFREPVLQKPLTLKIPGGKILLIINAGLKDGIFVFNDHGLISEKAFPGGNFFSGGILRNQKGINQPVLVVTFNREIALWSIR